MIFSGGTAWQAVQTTGIDVQKLAAGSDAMTLSANVNSPSQFDATKFNLESGGTVYNISTLSTGLATMGTAYHHGRSCGASPPNAGWNVMESCQQRPNGPDELFPNRDHHPQYRA